MTSSNQEELLEEIKDVQSGKRQVKDTKHYRELLRLSRKVRKALPDGIRALQSKSSSHKAPT